MLTIYAPWFGPKLGAYIYMWDHLDIHMLPDLFIWPRFLGLKPCKVLYYNRLSYMIMNMLSSNHTCNAASSHPHLKRLS